MPKTVTLRFLENQNACLEAIEWLKTQKDKSYNSLLKALIKDKKPLDWGIWYLSRKLNKLDKIRMAIFDAKQVLDIFEEKYPEDKRPRKAIAALKKYLRNPNRENKNAAAAAVRDAAAAADAAYAAKKDTQIKILKYGLKLLKNKN